MRKRIRQEKITEKKEKKAQTYSQAATTGTTTPNTTVNFNIETETGLKILTCMIHAHLTNAANSGTYSTTMAELLKIDNLSAVKMPSNPPSSKILQITTGMKDRN